MDVSVFGADRSTCQKAEMLPVSAFSPLPRTSCAFCRSFLGIDLLHQDAQFYGKAQSRSPLAAVNLRTGVRASLRCLFAASRVHKRLFNANYPLYILLGTWLRIFRNDGITHLPAALAHPKTARSLHAFPTLHNHPQSPPEHVEVLNMWPGFHSRRGPS